MEHTAVFHADGSSADAGNARFAYTPGFPKGAFSADDRRVHAGAYGAANKRRDLGHAFSPSPCYSSKLFSISSCCASTASEPSTMIS